MKTKLLCRKKYVIFSHHPRDSRRSGCATVFHAFLSEHAIYPYADYINVGWSPAEFDRQLRQKIDDDAVMVFNGVYSIVSSPNAITALRYAESYGTPVIVYWHETAWNLSMAFRNKAKRKMLHQYLTGDNVKHWAPSSQGKQLLMYLFKCSYEDVKVVYEAIPWSKTLRRPRLRTRSIRLCGSGYVDDLRKGMDYFIDISKTLPELNGTPCEYDWYWNVDPVRVKELYGDSGNVHFPGFVEDFSLALMNYDIFLLTSRDDPSPLVAIEALAAGLPVFCFDAVGTREIVPREFVAADPEEMINNIRQYWAQRNDYPPEFFRNISRHFSVEKFVAKVISENKSLRHSVFKARFTDENLYSLATHFAGIIDANDRILRHLKTNPVTSLELADITSAWFELDSSRPCDNNPEAVNPEKNHFYNYFRHWINSEAASCLPHEIIDKFQTMWARRYVTTACLCKMTLTAVVKNPAIRRIVIIGLGENGKKVLCRLQSELTPDAIRLCAWDDGINAAQCAKLGAEKVDPRQWRQWPEDCLAVITPLDDTPFRSPLARLKAACITGKPQELPITTAIRNTN